MKHFYAITTPYAGMYWFSGPDRMTLCGSLYRFTSKTERDDFVESATFGKAKAIASKQVRFEIARALFWEKDGLGEYARF